MSKWDAYGEAMRRTLELVGHIETTHGVDPDEVRVDPEYMYRNGERNLIHVDYTVPNRAVGKAIAGSAANALRPTLPHPNDNYRESWVEQEYRWFATIRGGYATIRVYVECSKEEEEDD